MSSLIRGSWIEELSTRESLHVLETFARFEAARSGAYSSDLIRLINDRDFDGLLNYGPNPKLHRGDPSDLIHAAQVVGFFKKFEPLGSTFKVDRKAKAWKKFLTSEENCKETNAVFRLWQSGGFYIPPDVSAELFRAKEKIAHILGQCPSFSAILPRLGPGASTTEKRIKAVPSYKLVPPFECAPNTVPYLESIFALNPHLQDFIPDDGEFHDDIVEIGYGRLEFVPKDALNYRSIVVEPVLTSMYQLGIGEVISQRLRLVGIDISDQSRNQELARLGSIHNHLCTLDLSSASDTISYALVKFLLPDDWFSLLTSFRSTFVTYQGVACELQKFSSMGNGFTFPLETLLFFALTWASSEHRDIISVYGDDIICSSLDAQRVERLLSFCGFTVNREKSFADGPFRESCGKDYYLGTSVRPYYQKARVSARTLFTLHNFYFRNYDREGCELVKTFIHPSLMIYGPYGYGDGHLWSAHPPLRPHKREYGWAGYTFETFSLKPRKSLKRLAGDYVALLYSVYAQDSTERMLCSAGKLTKIFPGTKGYKRYRVYTLSR